MYYLLKTVLNQIKSDLYNLDCLHYMHYALLFNYDSCFPYALVLNVFHSSIKLFQ